MAREELAPILAGALRAAAAAKREVVRENARVRSNGGWSVVNIGVAPIEEPEALRDLLVVTFRPSVTPQTSAGRKHEKAWRPESSRGKELERALRETRATLQSTIEEMETSNEEIKSTNEELQSTNEELQSTNEELQTSKEEMQSLNEELTTLNAELQNKVDELARANDDMQNLLNSTQFATIFLDRRLHVKRYTERAKDLIRLIPSDIGRPLGDLASDLDYPNLLSDCESVVKTLIPKETEVCDRKGTWHLMRVMPYRTAENVIDGVVIAFVNIDRLKSAELAAATVCDSFEDIVQTAREPLLVLDGRGRIFIANEAFCRMFDASRERLFGAGFHEAFNGRWDVPELHDLLEKSLPSGAGHVEATLSLGVPGGTSKTFSVRARKLERGGNLGRMILLTFEEG
jgi:two-component system CheB/CheR fusion protein